MPGALDRSSRSASRCIHILRNPLVGAVVVALVGVVAVIWSMSSYTGNASTVLSLGTADHDALLARLDVDPASVVDIDESAFIPIQGLDDVDEVMREFEMALIARAAATPGLRDAGIETWREFAGASTRIMAPFLTGDLNHLNENILTLGGAAPDTEEAQARLQSRWNVVTNTMQFTTAAPARVEIVDGRIESRNNAVRPGDAFDGKRLALRMGMRIPGGQMSTTGSRFPDVAAWDATDAPMEAYEVVLPVRLKHLKDGRVRLASIGVVMARGPIGGRWQPTMIILRFDQAGDQLEFHSQEELIKYAINHRPGNLHMQ